MFRSPQHTDVLCSWNKYKHWIIHALHIHSFSCIEPFIEGVVPFLFKHYLYNIAQLRYPHHSQTIRLWYSVNGTRSYQYIFLMYFRSKGDKRYFHVYFDEKNYIFFISPENLLIFKKILLKSQQTYRRKKANNLSDIIIFQRH